MTIRSMMEKMGMDVSTVPHTLTFREATMADQDRTWEKTPHTYYARPIQAMLLTGENLEEAARWCGGRLHTNEHDNRSRFLDVPHLEGTFTVIPGQWLIRAWDGQFNAMMPEDFSPTYSSTPELAARTDPTA